MTTEQTVSRSQRGEAARSKIKSAAIERFSATGYRGASIASIAGAAGLTLPGLLHHFPSKEALLLSILDDQLYTDAEWSESLAQEGVGRIDVLRQLLDRNMQDLESVRFFITLVAEGIATNHPAHGYFKARYEQANRMFTGHLENGKDAKEIRADADVEEVVPLVAAVMDGLQIQKLLDPSFDAHRAFGVFLDMLQARIGSSGNPG